MRLRNTLFSICAMSLLGFLAWAGAAQAASAIVRDGDTIQLGDTVYRLDGIDAPELDQICIDDQADPWSCGIDARDRLSKLIGGRSVHCDDLGPDKVCKKRHLGVCTVEGEKVSLNQQAGALGLCASDFEPAAKVHVQGRGRAPRGQAPAASGRAASSRREDFRHRQEGRRAARRVLPRRSRPRNPRRAVSRCLAAAARAAPSRASSRCARASPAISASIICRAARAIRRPPSRTAGSAPRTTPAPPASAAPIIAGRARRARRSIVRCVPLPLPSLRVGAHAIQRRSSERSRHRDSSASRSRLARPLAGIEDTQWQIAATAASA